MRFAATLILIASAVPAWAASCEDMAKVSFPDATISSAALSPAGTFTPPLGPPLRNLPAFCRVALVLKPSGDSHIETEVWLPAAGWNGKFVQVGNGGAAGSIVHGALAQAVSQGYAAANTDMGHEGAGGDFSWALGHPEKVTDYAWRSFHLLTGVGKAITAAHYGRPPSKSFGKRWASISASRPPSEQPMK